VSHELLLITVTAASVGLVHTILGPDHFVPFVVLSRARRWSLAKTVSVTAACGVAHVLSSVVLGALGIALGIAVAHLELVEAWRGDLAAWLLIAFGAGYLAWGVWHGIRHATGHHHRHLFGGHHHHHHEHHGHDQRTPGPGDRALESGQAAPVTPWVLFIVFVLGPCEPLIPILMYPAATTGPWSVALVAGVFGAVTVLTMLTIVVLATRGLARLEVQRVERWTHALAGAAILACGLGIRFLGL
jgi:nickel/cobalt exporter